MKKVFFFFFILFSSTTKSYAQPSNDTGFWTTFNISKKLEKNISLFLTEEYRLKENFSQTNLFYTDLGIEVRPLKFLKISVSYRFIQKYLEDRTFSYRHRATVNMLLKQKFGNFAFSYRQRIQSEVRNVYSSDLGSVPEWYSRNKFELKYDLDKPITPYIATEFRYQINNPIAVVSNKLWHRGRYIVGLDYKKNDTHTFGVYYLIQKEFNVSRPQNLYILGLEYSLSL